MQGGFDHENGCHNFLTLDSTLLLRQTPSAVSTIPKTKCPDVPAIKNPVKNAEAPAGTADLNSVIATVRAALKCYEDNRGPGAEALPHLQQAIFDFKTTTGKIGGIDVNFFIFKIKATRSQNPSRHSLKQRNHLNRWQTQSSLTCKAQQQR